MTDPRVAALPPVAEAVPAEMPWLWSARTSSPRLTLSSYAFTLGAIGVCAGHDPETVTAWVNEVQQARGARGWPESPWQSGLLASFDTGQAGFLRW